MAAAMNGSFSSPIADAAYKAVTNTNNGGLLSRMYNGVNGLSFAITVFLILVAYDQCECQPIIRLLVLRSLAVIVKYVWNKGSIVGPAWKMPFIGPFLSSVNPKMDEYKAKWASGELSCVSVFHKYE